MTLGAFVPSAVDDALYGVLEAEGLGRDLFHPRQHECCERVEHYAVHLALETARGLGVLPQAERAVDVATLARHAGVVEAFVPRLRWLLALLVDVGALVYEDGGYRLAADAPAADLATLRRAALEVDPAYLPTYEMLDEAAALYPRVARGETAAEPALLARPRLWVRYFSNANPFYAFGNHVAARAAARLVVPGAHVLEIGGGLGSSAEALLAALAARAAVPAVYRLTDPVPFFRRRAERGLGIPADCACEFSALDMNAPWAAQGVEPASTDLVWGVNAFHLARDQAAVFDEARQALRPGGVLVIGEGLRRRRAAPEPAEFPFQLLESFHAVSLDSELRPTPGFPYAPDLVRALEASGFESVAIVPSPARVAPYYAGFLGGAVTARRPSAPSASIPT